jgi:pyrroline-5-carboxylate reductase
MLHNKKSIGIIGFGNMGSAIAKRIYSKYSVVVFDKDINKTKNLSGVEVATGIIDLARRAEVVILAVKPQDFETVFNEIKDFINGKLVISIAAGITTGYIEKYLGRVRVVRAMPNLPAKVGKGITCLYKGEYGTKEDVGFTEGLFRYLGKTLVLDSEDMINAATAVSGSGPGFLFSLLEVKGAKESREYGLNIFMPQLKQAAQEVGFDKTQAYILAFGTTAGTLALMADTKLSAEALRIQVTSPRGTTEAGLKVLQNKIENLTEAVKAAKRRAEELSK